MIAKLRALLDRGGLRGVLALAAIAWGIKTVQDVASEHLEAAEEAEQRTAHAETQAAIVLAEAEAALAEMSERHRVLVAEMNPVPVVTPAAIVVVDDQYPHQLPKLPHQRTLGQVAP